MFTAAECFAKAEELTVLALNCGDEEQRKALNELASEWRAIALIAPVQDGSPPPTD